MFDTPKCPWSGLMQVLRHPRGVLLSSDGIVLVPCAALALVGWEVVVAAPSWDPSVGCALGWHDG